MSLWKFGNFEAEVDFTDADFLDVLEEAKAEMFEAGKKVPITGKQSDIIRAQCACFYVFFDTLFGDGAGERILCGKNSIKLCTEAAESLLDFETAETKIWTINMISMYQIKIQRSSSRIRSHSQMETVSREETTRNSMVKENIPIPEGSRA